MSKSVHLGFESVLSKEVLNDPAIIEVCLHKLYFLIAVNVFLNSSDTSDIVIALCPFSPQLMHR